ncbi:MAG: hypothetical protein HYS70_05675 [Nitrospinae bacterium]|nr:hypothetical protein [Nitrospinota bacterium]
MTEHYDSAWDGDYDDDAFDRKYEEWRRRDWMTWLSEKLSFPFEVERKEDMEENPFDPGRGPFSVGRRMQAVSLDEEHWKYGMVVRVTDGKKKGAIPLADVEVTSKTNPNYWPVREYVVWSANH